MASPSQLLLQQQQQQALQQQPPVGGGGVELAPFDTSWTAEDRRVRIR
jgi:hypothetical protein